MEISTPQRSLGPRPNPPPTSEKSLDELLKSGGWLENCLTDTMSICNTRWGKHRPEGAQSLHLSKLKP